MKIEGKVVSGSGRAAGYVRIFNRALLKEFGHEFFPGTLNVATDVSHDPDRDKLIHIKPPREGLYNVWCQKVEISGREAVLVFPEKSMHGKNILEVMSRYNLRNELELKDGDMVTISINDVNF